MTKPAYQRGNAGADAVRGRGGMTGALPRAPLYAAAAYVLRVNRG